MKYIAIKLQDGICLSFIFEDNVLYHILLCPFPIFDNKQQNTMWNLEFESYHIFIY